MHFVPPAKSFTANFVTTIAIFLQVSERFHLDVVGPRLSRESLFSQTAVNATFSRKIRLYDSRKVRDATFHPSFRPPTRAS
jgi:hypothetical protein